MPHIYRSPIRLTSWQSVLLPFCGFVYWGWASVTRQVFSRILNTGILYFSVDSMQTSEQECLASQSCNPLVNEEKRACRYSARPLKFMIPIQANIQVL